MFQVVHYTRKGRDIFQDWLDDLRDVQARKAIQRAIDRIEGGNLGVHRFCRAGVWELVFNIGPGYRVYYSVEGGVVILLLCGGDKSTQQRDIDRAIEYLQDFRKGSK